MRDGRRDLPHSAKRPARGGGKRGGNARLGEGRHPVVDTVHDNGVQVDAQYIEAASCQTSSEAQSELSEPDDGKGFGRNHAGASAPPAPMKALERPALPFAISAGDVRYLMSTARTSINPCWMR